MTPRDLTGPGTPEARWRTAPLLASLPRTSPADHRPSGRAVVVAPHPDDEVLGAGATLAAWAASGVRVTVVAVTDGEGSHPGSPTLAPDELVRRRAAERRWALGRLGMGDADVVRLGLPDGGVTRDRLVAALAGVVEAGDTLVAPLPGDGHPDHDAVADAVTEIAARRGASTCRFAVWLWHWGDPDDLPDRAAATAVLPPAWALAAKEAAVACFLTQTEPLSSDPRDAAVLPPFVLARLLREVEVLWPEAHP